MTPTLYVLWSTVSAGWLTKGSTYSSDLADAWEMEWPDASALCKTHYGNGNAEFGLLPVDVLNLAALR